MPLPALGDALRRAKDSDPAGVPEILAEAAASFGAANLVLYLVDFGQTTLEPVPVRRSQTSIPTSEPVAATMAGRAFIDQVIVTAERDSEVRAWIPVAEGSNRTGVLALTLPAFDASLEKACEELGLLTGYLIAAHARCTDVYNMYRRRRSLNLAASMQWDLLPPLTIKTESVSVAGLVEPAYDVGGDCFDYAANGPTFDVAIMDAMGHGLGSATVAGLAMGSYRHDRRESRSLPAMHTALGSAITSQYRGATFVTGLLARLDCRAGILSWTNAGHPHPLLVRQGHVVGELRCKPTPPWGAIDGAPTVATEALEPGDAVLLYTDGVVEARTPEGELFGADRLVDLTSRVASDLLRPEDIVRHLVRAVTDHQATDLSDDATVVLMRWDGPTE
jgi:serine phosphatase RsbU (regulator of sigma subunit)